MARVATGRVLACGGILSLFLLYYTWSRTAIASLGPSIWRGPRARSVCSPDAYGSKQGRWEFAPKTNRTKTLSSDDALAFSGFEGCASSREFFWHLASDNEKQWDRLPRANSWKWVPGEECGLRDFVREEMVRDLVEQGGWLILGDSISEGHFFSISCLLYPHVRATPDYVANPYFDRSWPQNLYLNPDSPLIPNLRFPKGFDITSTPLVTFRRVDLLLEQKELADLHRSIYNPSADFKLFSEEAAWNVSPEYYLQLFTAPLPEANYGTMVVSTAGHWTTTLFSGYRDEDKKDSGYGIDGVLEFFGRAMQHWADRMQKALSADRTSSVGGHRLGKGGRGERSIVVRAYLPGHEDCHDHREPSTEIQPFQWDWYNWRSIGDFNDIFRRVLSSPRFPSINYLPIERPGRLRPDAHVSSDCLHIMTGAGVMEGWTHFIWHYITRELHASGIR